MTRESYINGVSAKKVGKIIAELGITDISPSTGSPIAGELDEEINAFLTRPVETNIPSLFVDTAYFKVRYGGRYLNTDGKPGNCWSKDCSCRNGKFLDLFFRGTETTRIGGSSAYCLDRDEYG